MMEILIMLCCLLALCVQLIVLFALLRSMRGAEKEAHPETDALPGEKQEQGEEAEAAARAARAFNDGVASLLNYEKELGLRRPGEE